MRKLLSIIIPSYNMEKYLDKCIGSCMVDDPDLLQQLEILVVNDGSKDRTSEIGHSWERNYPGVVRVIDKANGNYGSCINAALPRVSGIYVKILDADDYVETANFAASLRKLGELAQEQDPVDLFVTQYGVVDEAGNVSSVANFGLESEGYKVFADKPADSPRFMIHSVVYRTEILHRLNYRQTEGISYTDTEWIIEPMALVRRFYYFNRMVTKYLVGRAGQTMEVETFRRRFQQVADVTRAIVSRFDRIYALAHPNARAFYEKLVLQMVELVYSASIWGGRMARWSAISRLLTIPSAKIPTSLPQAIDLSSPRGFLPLPMLPNGDANKAQKQSSFTSPCSIGTYKPGAGASATSRKPPGFAPTNARRPPQTISL